MRIRLLLTLTAIVLSSHYLFGQSGLRPRGDVNCDWEVTIADVNTLIDSVLNGTTYHSFYNYATDINGDEEINISDINMVI